MPVTKLTDNETLQGNPGTEGIVRNYAEIERCNARISDLQSANAHLNSIDPLLDEFYAKQNSVFQNFVTIRAAFNSNNAMTDLFAGTNVGADVLATLSTLENKFTEVRDAYTTYAVVAKGIVKKMVDDNSTEITSQQSTKENLLFR